MTLPPRTNSKAVLVTEGGERIPFDFSEIRSKILHFLAVHTHEPREETADEIIKYFAEVVGSLKMSSRFKPWRFDTTNPGGKSQPGAGAYRRGVHDGWELLQEVVKSALETNNKE